MLRKMKGILREERGFTLIELMVVLIIIAVLAAVAVPLYSGSINQARSAEAIQAISAIAQAAEGRRAATGSYPDSLTIANYITVDAGSNFSYAYDASGDDPAITATGKNDLDSGDTITCTLQAGQKPTLGGGGGLRRFHGSLSDRER